MNELAIRYGSFFEFVFERLFQNGIVVILSKYKIIASSSFMKNRLQWKSSKPQKEKFVLMVSGK